MSAMLWWGRRLLAYARRAAWCAVATCSLQQPSAALRGSPHCSAGAARQQPLCTGKQSTHLAGSDPTQASSKAWTWQPPAGRGRHWFMRTDTYGRRCNTHLRLPPSQTQQWSCAVATAVQCRVVSCSTAGSTVAGLMLLHRCDVGRHLAVSATSARPACNVPSQTSQPSWPARWLLLSNHLVLLNRLAVGHHLPHPALGVLGGAPAVHPKKRPIYCWSEGLVPAPVRAARSAAAVLGGAPSPRQHWREALRLQICSGLCWRAHSLLPAPCQSGCISPACHAVRA